MAFKKVDEYLTLLKHDLSLIKCYIWNIFLHLHGLLKTIADPIEAQDKLHHYPLPFCKKQ